MCTIDDVFIGSMVSHAVLITCVDIACSPCCMHAVHITCGPCCMRSVLYAVRAACGSCQQVGAGTPQGGVYLFPLINANLINATLINATLISA